MSNEIKMLIFDIDGTLIPKGHRTVLPSALKAIKEVESKGIKTMIATGRAIYFVQDDIFESLKSDYYVTINGQCVLDKERNILYKHTIDEESFFGLIEECKKNDVACAMKYDDRIYVYHMYDEYVRVYLKGEVNNHLVVDHTHLQNIHKTQGMPMSIFLIGDNDIMATFSEKFPRLSCVKAYDRGMECFNKDHNKGTAIEEVLHKLNITWDECMAFGDADNDTEMIVKAKIGVALGNATENLKNRADYISSDILEDGVAKAIYHFIK